MQGGTFMPSYYDLSVEALRHLQVDLEQQYATAKSSGLKLNMTRGKPCPEQLDLANGLLTALNDTDYCAADGTDCRNYGGIDGILEARTLFAAMLDTKPEHVLVSSNSSLNLMYDTLVRAMLFKMPDGSIPWGQEDKIRFICPTPGYDRHFFITQTLGIDMITVPMTNDGPDMDQLEALVAADPAIKGMWAVPVYSNPDGITYSAETCRRLAAMKTAAPDFRIIWDNSYVVHHLYPDQKESVPDMIKLCADAGNANRVLEFSSTSKITFAGAGIACIAASIENLQFIRKQMSIQTIGPDKICQLRHARFLKNMDGIDAIMAQHAAILRPKFEATLRILDETLAGTDICTYNHPRGGYFVSLFVMPGTATEVVRLAKECGVELTPAGNPFPYGKDEHNSNIRLAPSFPSLTELETAMVVVCLCIRLAAVKKLLSA
jgi:aspartate/methionine/tyrosine aminotransferase